jgi:uncharacterized membrane protein (UPF0127 family)
MKKYIFLLFLFSLLTLIFLILRSSLAPKFKIIKINQKEILVEIADNKLKRKMGLSGRDFLPENQGMIFIFDKPDYYSFWMKNMKFPIDIIWVDENWQIIDITEKISPESFPKSFQPKKPIKYVIEVNAGFVEKNNIKIGDKINFK